MTVTLPDVEKLDRVANPRDVRRDLHNFVRFVRRNSIKRSVRGNDLGKSDRQKICRSLHLPSGDEGPDWIRMLDEYALALGFTDYSTQGVYQGYSSQEKIYPDNYMEFRQKCWDKFLAQTPLQQERAILDASMGCAATEFFYTATMSRLDRFDSAGCAVGVVPTLDFPASRRFLLGLLARLEAGVWHETDAFVERLRVEHPRFLIPGKVKTGFTRYMNFRERQPDKYWADREPIPDAAPDGFARVEGRWLERFLEGVPLELGYVEVAYGPSRCAQRPSLGRLRAFRISPRLKAVLADSSPPARMRVQPNFDVFVESPLYPWSCLERLVPFCEEVSAEHPVYALRLKRDLVVARRAQDETFDPTAVLRAVADGPLPSNVVSEVEEWAGRGDAFVLYEGFGVWEGEEVKGAGKHVVEPIAPNVRLVRDVDGLAHALVQAALVPARVHHADGAWRKLPAGTRTLFPMVETAGPAQRKKRAETIGLRRKLSVTLFFPEGPTFDAAVDALTEAGVALEVLRAVRAFIYAARDEKRVQAVLQAVSKARDIVFSQEDEP